jgi:hypothetical protein
MADHIPAPPPATGPDPAVAGLAREIEALRRQLADLAQLPRRVEQLADLLARLAEQTAAQQAAGPGTLTWLDLPTDRPDAAADAEQILARLAGWLASVYLRYTDAARTLPGCWLWHPEVVEELLCLHQAWLAAYADPDAPVSTAADWHDRLRPGVVRRIKDYAGMCSLETHQPGGDRHTPAPTVPAADAAPAIATWWTTDRTTPPPEPTADQARAAGAARPTRGWR